MTLTMMTRATKKRKTRTNNDQRGGRLVLPPRSLERRGSPIRKRKRKDTPMLVLAVVLLCAGALAFFLPVLMTDMEITQDAADYSALRRQIADANSPMLTPVTDDFVRLNSWQTPDASQMPPTVPASAQRKPSVDLAACKAANVDFIAWLQIPNTTVDYPVVWSDDTDYYLHHTFVGKKSYIGTLFSLKKTDFQAPSRNIAIYGHHIRSNDKVMFSPLLAYKEQSFYADHDTIYLDTLYHVGVYKVFAVLNMHNGDWEPSTADFTNDEDFLGFADRAKAQALYDTGVEVQASDQILTLITCDRSYGGKDGRLIVMAVKQK